MADLHGYRNIRYRLLPGSRATARQLFGLAGASRFVWNHFLGKNQEAYRLHREHPEQHAKPSVSFFALAKEFTAFRNGVECPWLRGYAFKVTRAPLQSLALAFQAFFRGKGHPRFKARGRDRPRFTIPDGVKIRGEHLHVPGIGLVRLRRHGGNPYADGQPVKAVVVHECGKWYATVCYRVALPPREEPELTAAMDRNCGQVAVAYSDGSSQQHLQPASKRLAARLKRCQRKLARQRQGSNRRWRTKLRFQRLHRRIRNVGNTWRHRLSRGIANRARLLVLEKLNSQGMTSSGKGTVEQPGVNVRAKAGLNRSILATGWAELEQMLSYKTRVVYVDPAYTSQTCARCGHVDRASRRSQSVFHCTSCGHCNNADLNAAENILASGIGATARREAFPSGTSTTREIGADSASLESCA